jgi:hypothetical protein
MLEFPALSPQHCCLGRLSFFLDAQSGVSVSLKYRISSIGWYNFEILAQTLLKVLIGPGVTSFGGSKDSGRDAAFTGDAAFPTPSCRWTGEWVFQVKYVDFEERGVDAARSSLNTTLRKELPLVLSRHSAIDNYVLITDVPLTSQSRMGFNRIASEHGFAGNFASVDGKEICQFLDIHGDIRRSYPQLLGLADLDIIVNRDLYARSQAYLETWQPRLATYVQTEAHAKALTLLKKRHFIVLDGPPEAGKSTIAAALALIHAAEGFEIIDVRASNDLFRAPGETTPGSVSSGTPKLFVADDAIGSISLEDGRVEEWSRDLPGIVRKLSDKRLLIWTARRYILEEALTKSRLGDAVAEFPRSHEVLVEVGPLTQMQKGEMLYNHAKQAALSVENKKLIKTAAAIIVTHPNFSPLRVSQLTSVVMKSTAAVTWEELFLFFNNPGERWVQAFRALSVSEQLLLTSTLDFSGPAPAKDLRASYELRVSQSGHRHLSFEECVARLDHSFLSVTVSHDGERQVAVQHPSLSELLLVELRDDAHARKRYFSFANPFGLARVIGGIAEKRESEVQPEHSIVPENDVEFEIFIGRLRGVSQKVLTFRDWDMLLTSAERLLPLKPHSEKLDALLSILPPGVSSVRKVEPNEMDLQAFSREWKGQIIRAVLEGFASRNTFEKSDVSGPDAWTRLLSTFYRLTAYTTPPIYPSFTVDLCGNLDGSLDSIRLANLVHGSEPVVIKQRISMSRLEEWVHKIESEAEALVEQGEGFSYRDDPDEFDEWDSESKKLLGTVENFAKWGTTQQLSSALEELESVLESAERPQERESDEFEEPTLPESGPYWTIGRLFEDL